MTIASVRRSHQELSFDVFLTKKYLMWNYMVFDFGSSIHVESGAVLKCSFVYCTVQCV